MFFGDAFTAAAVNTSLLSLVRGCAGQPFRDQIVAYFRVISTEFNLGMFRCNPTDVGFATFGFQFNSMDHPSDSRSTKLANGCKTYLSRDGRSPTDVTCWHVKNPPLKKRMSRHQRTRNDNSSWLLLRLEDRFGSPSIFSSY